MIVLPQRRQSIDLGGYRTTGCDRVRDDALVDVEITFIFPSIAYFMALGEHPPYFRTETKRVRQNLKHDVPVAQTQAVITQHGQAQRMRRVVGKIEAPLERVRRLA